MIQILPILNHMAILTLDQFDVSLKPQLGDVKSQNDSTETRYFLFFYIHVQIL